MTNAYCDLVTLKSAGALNITGSVYDLRAPPKALVCVSLLEEASRQIDNPCQGGGGE